MMVIQSKSGHGNYSPRSFPLERMDSVIVKLTFPSRIIPECSKCTHLLPYFDVCLALDILISDDQILLKCSQYRIHNTADSSIGLTL